MKKKPSPPPKTPTIQVSFGPGQRVVQVSPDATLYAAIQADARENHIGLATRIKQILAGFYGL